MLANAHYQVYRHQDNLMTFTYRKVKQSYMKMKDRFISIDNNFDDAESNERHPCWP